MRPTRRALLTAVAAGTAAGCTGRPRPSERPAAVDPDVALRAAAVARERGLLAAYDAALQAAPDRAARLAPLRAEHAAHLAALGETGSAAAAVPAPAGTLPAVERAAAQEHARDTAAASPQLAALLAQLAASEASHPVALA